MEDDGGMAHHFEAEDDPCGREKRKKRSSPRDVVGLHHVQDHLKGKGLSPPEKGVLEFSEPPDSLRQRRGSAGT